LPDQPVSQDGYGPRNDEERRIYELINEALAGDFKEYETVEELLEDLLGKADSPG
jgi:hypothetical protein